MLVLQLSEGAVLSPYKWILVSCIGAGHHPGIQIQNTQPHGNKHFRIVLTDLVIHRMQDLAGTSPLLSPIVEEDLCRHHEQRRRDTFIRDIRDQHCKMVFIDQQEIIKISSDFLCRGHAGIQVEISAIRKCRKNTWQHG